MWLNMQATKSVIGDFEPPGHLVGNHPDMGLIAEARQLLNYKTNYTLLEWWCSFPVGKWWRYALLATQSGARKPNYKYFLKCLLSAARAGKDKLDQMHLQLRKLYGDLVDRDNGVGQSRMAALVGDLPAPPHDNCTCERCMAVTLQLMGQMGMAPPRGVSKWGAGDTG